MVVQEKQFLTEINNIHRILYSKKVNEQLISMSGPIVLHHTSKQFDKLGDWIKTWDFHDWMTFIDISATAIGFISGPFAPVFFGIAIAAAAADAGKYASEGDYYMAGFVLAFSIVPFGELLKYVKKAAKLGPKETIELLKKIKIGKATKEEVTLGKEIVEEFGRNSEKIAKLTTKEIISNFLENFAKLSLKTMVQTILLLIHTGKAVAKGGVMIAGIYYTYDEIYLALNADNLKNKKIRYNSKIQKLIRSLKLSTNLETVKDQSVEFMKLHKDILEKNPEKLVTVDPSKNSKKLDDIQKNAENNINTSKFKTEVTPTINDVINDKGVIKKGMKGPSINYIQKILNNIGYSDFLVDFKQGVNPTDSVFGKNTEMAIYIFQGDNGLRETGIVDSETLKKLISKSKVQNN